MTQLVIISSNNLDRTIIVRINEVKYEYWFHGEVPLATLRKIHRYSTGKAINYLKQKSWKVERLDGQKKSA